MALNLDNTLKSYSYQILYIETVPLNQFAQNQSSPIQNVYQRLFNLPYCYLWLDEEHAWKSISAHRVKQN